MAQEAYFINIYIYIFIVLCVNSQVAGILLIIISSKTKLAFPYPSLCLKVVIFINCVLLCTGNHFGLERFFVFVFRFYFYYVWVLLSIWMGLGFWPIHCGMFTKTLAVAEENGEKWTYVAETPRSKLNKQSPTPPTPGFNFSWASLTVWGRWGIRCNFSGLGAVRMNNLEGSV